MEAKMMDIPGFVSFMRYYAGYATGITSISSSAMHAATVHSLCTSLLLPYHDPCLEYDTMQDTLYFAEPYASVDACTRSACSHV